MSLRRFHLFFITICALLALFLIVWGFYDFRMTGEGMSLGLSLLGTIGLVFLSVYFRWFRQKYSKLSAVALVASIVSLSFQPRLAVACAVCFGDPDSLMTKGALMGVGVLAAIIISVLAGIAYLGYSWHQRAKLLATHL